MPKHVVLSMPKHVPVGLHELQHPVPLNPQYSLAKHTIPECGSKTQCADNEDDMQLVLPDDEIKCIQKVLGTTSYHDIALDSTAPIALNDLATSQASAKQSTKDDLAQLLDYFSTHPNAEIRRCEIPMTLQTRSDSSCM